MVYSPAVSLTRAPPAPRYIHAQTGRGWRVTIMND